MPCGAQSLDSEDMIRVARIAGEQVDEVAESLLVFRLGFQKVHESQEGLRGYQFVARTAFFLPLFKVRATESCSLVVPASVEFEEGICP